MRTWIKAIIAVVITASLVGSHWFTHDRALRKGLDMYHEVCYTTGPGFVVNEQGQVVMCGPLTTIPQDEARNFLNTS